MSLISGLWLLPISFALAVVYLSAATIVGGDITPNTLFLGPFTAAGIFVAALFAFKFRDSKALWFLLPFSIGYAFWAARSAVGGVDAVVPPMHFELLILCGTLVTGIIVWHARAMWPIAVALAVPWFACWSWAAGVKLTSMTTWI